ncbi:hypothetical protein EGW08_013310, partial [Elysia chlorotica]
LPNLFRGVLVSADLVPKKTSRRVELSVTEEQRVVQSWHANVTGENSGKVRVLHIYRPHVERLHVQSQRRCCGHTIRGAGHVIRIHRFVELVYRDEPLVIREPVRCFVFVDHTHDENRSFPQLVSQAYGHVCHVDVHVIVRLDDKRGAWTVQAHPANDGHGFEAQVPVAVDEVLLDNVAVDVIIII